MPGLLTVPIQCLLPQADTSQATRKYKEEKVWVEEWAEKTPKNWELCRE